MLFCTWPFAVFFALVFAAYWSLPGHRTRVWLLVFASGYFTPAGTPRSLSSSSAFACLDYLLGLALDASTTPAVDGPGSSLGWCSTWDCSATSNTRSSFSAPWSKRCTQPVRRPRCPSFDCCTDRPVVLHFEAINYLVDIYRGRLAAERDLGHFLLFILFFPHLVAGPIVQARDFLPQLCRPRRWTAPPAPRLAILPPGPGQEARHCRPDGPLRRADLCRAGSYSSGALWLATLAYAMQVYGDFSGYSDMAIGCAHMLGYKLTLTFVCRIWRSHGRLLAALAHLALDVVAEPCVYSARRQSWRELAHGPQSRRVDDARGLWHGANWNYVVWGLLHGLLLIVNAPGPLFASVVRDCRHCCGLGQGRSAHRVYVLLFLPDVGGVPLRRLARQWHMLGRMLWPCSAWRRGYTVEPSGVPWR